MASGILASISSGNSLLPDGTKPLPKPMLTYHPFRIHSRMVFTLKLKISIPKLCLKITQFKSQSHISGDNELITYKQYIA